MRERFRAAGCAALFAAACAAPPASAPPASPGATLAARAAAAGGAATATDVDLALLGLAPWWSGLDSPALDRSVRAALARNPDLDVAAARVAAARAQARAVAGARLPAIGAGLELTRARRNWIGLPLPGAPEVLSTTISQDGLGMDLSWEADLWGRLAAAERAAIADAEASASDGRAVGLALAGQTARSWLTLAHQDELLALLAERERVASDALRLARRRHAGGAGPASAISDAEAADLALRAELSAERSARAAARAQLDRLEGRPALASVEEPGFALPAIPPPLAADLPAETLAARPDLEAAAARVVAARARADEADAALLPRLTLTASGGTASSALGDLLDGDLRVWSLAGGLFAPLFEGGRLRARSDGAAALARAAEEEYVGRALIALAEVEAALAADARLREAHGHALEAAAAREREWLAARRRLAGGAGDAALLLAREDAALEARGRALSLRYAALLNRVDLMLALGGAAPPAMP